MDLQLDFSLEDSHALCAFNVPRKKGVMTSKSRAASTRFHAASRRRMQRATPARYYAQRGATVTCFIISYLVTVIAAALAGPGRRLEGQRCGLDPDPRAPSSHLAVMAPQRCRLRCAIAVALPWRLACADIGEDQASPDSDVTGATLRSMLGRCCPGSFTNLPKQLVRGDTVGRLPAFVTRDR